jgi:molecular chaperone DnaK
MASFIGIDLGTTYSVISYFDETGRPKIIHNSDGENVTASCIAFKGSEVEHTGEEARKMLGIEDNVVARFKRDMGEKTKYTINGKKYTPTQLSAEILKRLYFDAKEKIGEIEEAVITVPANFPNKARVETKKAAKLAGIKVKHTIDEPTAAALYYGFEGNGALKGYYAVYDLGGGTFDISIVKIDGFDVEVVATDGIPKLGGDDFDAALQKIIQKKYLKATGEELEEQDFTKTMAEEHKISLSKRDIKPRVVKETIEVSQSEFEDEISPWIARAEMTCENLIELSKIKLDDIEAVFLVGGSTRIPLVQQSVKRVFKMTPKATNNVDEVVSLGASIYAALQGDQSKLNAAQKASINKISVQDVTPAYYGCVVRDIDKEKEEVILKVAIVIDKNVKRPCSFTETFYTPYDNCPKISARMTASNSLEADPDFVNIIWDGYLEPLPHGNSQGDPIEVTYSFDDDGIMHASFVDINSGVRIDIDISDLDGSDDSIKID